MAYRNANYTAFYVSEPFSESNLGAASTRDFVTYNMLRAWKGADTSFPFIDAHDKTYNVRDGSDWEMTLKPRLRERIRNSKNIVLVLSSVTRSSRALREEIDYGINNQDLPVIVIYPEFKEKSDIIETYNGRTRIKGTIVKLWDNLPIFRDSMGNVPTLHVPMQKNLIRSALNDEDFMLNSKCSIDKYWYKL